MFPPFFLVTPPFFLSSTFLSTFCPLFVHFLSTFCPLCPLVVTVFSLLEQGGAAAWCAQAAWTTEGWRSDAFRFEAETLTPCHIHPPPPYPSHPPNPPCLTPYPPTIVDSFMAAEPTVRTAGACFSTSPSSAPARVVYQLERCSARLGGASSSTTRSLPEPVQRAKSGRVRGIARLSIENSISQFISDRTISLSICIIRSASGRYTDIIIIAYI